MKQIIVSSIDNEIITILNLQNNLHGYMKYNAHCVSK